MAGRMTTTSLRGSVSRGCVLAKPADDLLCSAALRGPASDGDIVVKFGC